jgi:hypothetical protein
MKRTFEENLNELSKFCENNGRLPITGNESKDEKRLSMFRFRYKDSPEIIRITNKYRSKPHNSFDENFSDFIKFCKDNGRLPNNRNKMEKRLSVFSFRNKNNTIISEMIEKYRKVSHNSFDVNYNDLVKFCNENNRLPKPQNKGIEMRLSEFIKRYKSNVMIIEILNKYRKFKRG